MIIGQSKIPVDFAMQVGSHIGTVLLACVVFFSNPQAKAEDALIALTMAGEAFEGPPRFRFIADNRIIGGAAIASALETAKGERLKFQNGAEKRSSERILFAVPSIESVSQLDIEFVNDAWAGKDKPGDRNLYVLALSLVAVKRTSTEPVAETRDFSPLAFQAVIQQPEGAYVTPRFAALYQQGRLRLRQPEGGWTAASARSVSQNEKKPAAPPTPCRRAQLELKGFGKNTASLLPPMLEELDKAGKALRGTSCSVRVAAFTSGATMEYRTKLSLDRAKAVARELVRLGLARERIQVETSRGGGRRVVVSFE